ncbi:MAG: CopD family protein [Candidatus Azotimanducaceae bacterium WSBS_2022_MAG_OTU7]
MLWIKTFHILFVMAWLAGVFYLPQFLFTMLKVKLRVKTLAGLSPWPRNF